MFEGSLDQILAERLLAYPPAERAAWQAEVLRLARLVFAYGQLHPKRRKSQQSGAYEFTDAVKELCLVAPCQDPFILSREPHRAQAISPYTLDDWWRAWHRDGLAVFLRRPLTQPAVADRRRVVMSAEAVAYVEEHWRQFRSPRALYRALQAEGEKQGWSLPSESWLYRRWQEMPKVVRVVRLEGMSTYEARYAPYVPRNYEDLTALQ
ncbi:MAG TPA: DNA-binding domain-containing protein, partial [Blastocatellia bacterium]|nr:DNA-binding domain-containing protein [Blastocatellia bacterium]